MTYTLNKSKWGTHRIIARLIGSNKRVLDIGCSEGYLATLAPANTFIGVDSDKQATIKARKTYEEVYHLDLNNYQDFQMKDKVEVLVFADVLEHLVEPDKVLHYFVSNYLSEGGRVIISLPNVAHITIRLGLLLGKFNYTDNGILDKTHLHLYTLTSAKDLIKKAGLETRGTFFSSNRFGPLIKVLPFLSTILGFNLILLCQKKS